MADILPAGAASEGLPHFKGADWHEHTETARALIESIEMHRWQLAAVCASVEVKYGEESFSQFASEIGWSTRSVYAYAQTYRTWELRKRSQILSFHHHTIAARAEDPEKAIEEAEIEELSTRELERRLQGKESIERFKVYVVLLEHHDDHIAGPQCVFRDEQDAMRFAELHDEAFSEGFSRVEEMEVYETLAQQLDEGDGAAFCEMFAEDDRPMPDELKPYDLEEEEIKG